MVRGAIHVTTVVGAFTAAAPGQSVCSLDIGLGGLAEPSIAVNPNDPDNIAIGYIARVGEVELVVSTDGGVTWSTPPTLPLFPASYDDPAFEPFTIGDPVVAFDSSGRLFWSYLVAHGGEPCDCNSECACEGEPTVCSDIVVVQASRTTGQIIGDAVPVSGTRQSDKQWMVADANVGSQFQDRLYMVWVENYHWCLLPNFPGAPRPVVHSAYSDTSGATWSTPIPLSSIPTPDPEDPAIDVHPSHIAVSANGDVYVVHWQVGIDPVMNGHVKAYRSTTGGASWTALADPFSPGDADGTSSNCFNERIPGTQFRMRGNHQPWILADPLDNGRLFVIAYDDPDGTPGSGDDGDIMIARSEDFGVAWTDPIRVDHAQAQAFSVFPTATISPQTGAIAVMWYDNRVGGLNEDDNYLLDIFFTVSTDHGLTFRPDHQLSDTAFDPDFGALSSLPCGGGPTTFIGDYVGIGFAGCDLLGVWTDNSETGLQVVVGEAFDQCGDCPWDTNDDNQVSTGDLLELLTTWGTDPCGPPDTDGDGDVGTSDLLQLLAHWGLCGSTAQGPPQTVQDCIDRFGFEDPVVLEQCICGVEPTTEGCP